MDEIKCPRCGSENIIPIIYGVPNQKGSEASKRGEIKLGGIRQRDDQPNLCCSDCGMEWFVEFEDDEE